MSYLIIVAFCVGFILGYFCPRLKKEYNARLTQVSHDDAVRLGQILSQAGDALILGEFEYAGGGMVIRKRGLGIVQIKGNLALRKIDRTVSRQLSAPFVFGSNSRSPLLKLSGLKSPQRPIE